MVVNRNGKRLFGLILTDHISVQKSTNLFRGLQVYRKVFRGCFIFFYNNVMRLLNTFVTDVSIHSCYQQLCLRFGKATEGTT